jgi:hypothetical protein
MVAADAILDEFLALSSTGSAVSEEVGLADVIAGEGEKSVSTSGLGKTVLEESEGLGGFVVALEEEVDVEVGLEELLRGRKGGVGVEENEGRFVALLKVEFLQAVVRFQHLEKKKCEIV